MKYCPLCSDEFADDARFCPSDGSGLLDKVDTHVQRDPFLGRVLADRYRVVKRLGEGGMGAVYLAENIHAELQVALKVLNRHASRDKVLMQRFEAERKIISRLRHPNILKLLDSFHTVDSELVVVTEFVNGKTLEDRIGGKPMPQSEVLYILSEVFDALVEAHEQGVIHRDLKPSNIMLERVGDRQMVKILDFGIAKSLSSTGVTATGKTLGTPAYMSPEQVQGFALDARSDLYSMGIVAFECLSGRIPFSGENPFSIIRKHIQEPPPSLVQHIPSLGVTTDIEALIFTLLAKKPAHRFASAKAARDRSRTLCQPGAASPSTTPPQPMVVEADQPTGATGGPTTDSTLSDEMVAASFSAAIAPTAAAPMENFSEALAAEYGEQVPSDVGGGESTDDSLAWMEAPRKRRRPGYIGVFIALTAVVILWAVFFSGEAKRAAKDEKSAEAIEKVDTTREVPAVPIQEVAVPKKSTAGEALPVPADAGSHGAVEEKKTSRAEARKTPRKRVSKPTRTVRTQRKKTRVTPRKPKSKSVKKAQKNPKNLEAKYDDDLLFE